MKKVKLLGFYLFLCSLFCLGVNAESLEISLGNNSKSYYEFDVHVKDIKEEKINVITGNVTYDKSLFSGFEIVEVSGWKLYKKQNDNNLSFVLVNMNGYASENMNVFDIKTSFSGEENVNINLDSIESSSSSSIININDVNFKYEIPFEEIVVPDDELTNNIEGEESGTEVEENGSIVDDEKEEIDENIEKKEDVSSNNKSYSLFGIFLIIIILIVILFIIFRNKDKKGGK